MTVAGQPQVTYTYDNANRLTQIAQGTSTVSFGYDNANRRTSLAMSNGVNVSYTYDNDSRVTGITYNFNATLLGTLTYSYDELGRRTQVGGSFAQTALPQPVASAGYDAANELTNWNGTTIGYDLNGNMLSDGANAFTWNARNQVASLNGVALKYDAFGRRTQNLGGTSFLYDGANAAQELSGTTPTANLLSGGIDEIFSRSDSSGTLTPLLDALGSTIALIDASGNLVTSYAYEPFGGMVVSGQPGTNAFQYTGRENEGNGLYYYRARYYAPTLGRFLSQDPLRFSGGDTNLFASVGNEPTNFRDSSGMRRDCPVPRLCGETINPSQLSGRKDDHWWRDFGNEMVFGDWTTGTRGKQLCFLEFMGATGAAMNPLDFQIDNAKDWVEIASKSTSLLLNNLAFIHAATATNVFGFPGLIKPYNSSTVRGLLGASEEVEAMTPLLTIDGAAALKGLPAEWDSATEDKCDATFF